MTETSSVVPMVLIVDDDSTMRLLMRHTLKKAGFNVEEASGGSKALEIFQRQHTDIVLLDVMMPEMDGYTVCRKLRNLSVGKHVPILMVTGLDDVESINKAYEAGATDFITKPITFPLLGHRVRYVLRSSQAMEQLGKSEARLAHAQKIARLGNWEWNIVRNEIHWSEEIYTIFGLQPGTVTPNFDRILQLVHPEDKPFMLAYIKDILTTSENKGLDYRIILPDGTIRIVSSQGEVIFDEKQQPIQASGTIQDVTERKRVENELKLYRDHLEEVVGNRTAELKVANADLQIAKTQAEQANALKDKFVSLVAHDLRSPLAGIISALEYLYSDSDPPLNAEHQEIVGRLLLIGKSLVQMIEDVLNISRLRTGKITPKPELLDGYKAVTEVIANLDYLAKQKGIDLINEVSQGVQFFADFALFKEVIQNLASNGIKFCKKGDKVRFFIPVGQPHVLAVQDTGTGINPDMLPKLFKIEEKTSTPGTAGEQGTGFGLPFSQDIMVAHGGTLRVESVVGEGTTFFIQLPPI